MKAKTTHDYLLIRESINPFLKRTTESGLYLPDGLADSKETGDIEQLDKVIGFAIVAAVGDECRFVKEGDGIFYDRRSLRPVPMDETLWQMSERNTVAYVDKDELHTQFEQFAKEELVRIQREEAAYEKRMAEETQRKAKEKIEYDKKVASGEVAPSTFAFKIDGQYR